MAGEVLEHRQQAGVAQPLGVGARVLDDLRRIGAERAVADHLVVGFRRDVDDGCEVDRDAEAAHGLAALERDVVDLVGCLGLRQHPRRRLAADQRRTAATPGRPPRRR